MAQESTPRDPNIYNSPSVGVPQSGVQVAAEALISLRSPYEVDAIRAKIPELTGGIPFIDTDGTQQARLVPNGGKEPFASQVQAFITDPEIYLATRNQPDIYYKPNQGSAGMARFWGEMASTLPGLVNMQSEDLASHEAELKALRIIHQFSTPGPIGVRQLIGVRFNIAGILTDDVPSLNVEQQSILTNDELMFQQNARNAAFACICARPDLLKIPGVEYTIEDAGRDLAALQDFYIQGVPNPSLDQSDVSRGYITQVMLGWLNRADGRLADISDRITQSKGSDFTREDIAEWAKYINESEGKSVAVPENFDHCTTVLKFT